MNNWSPKTAVLLVLDPISFIARRKPPVRGFWTRSTKGMFMASASCFRRAVWIVFDAMQILMPATSSFASHSITPGMIS